MNEPSGAVPSSGGPVEYQWTWWRMFLAAFLFVLLFRVIGGLFNGIVRFGVGDIVIPAVVAVVVASGWWLIRGRRRPSAPANHG